MRCRWISVVFVSAILLLMPRLSSGLFHVSVINQLMTSYACDLNVQFLEIRMLVSLQNFVTNGVVGAFDASGVYVGDVLIVPHDVAMSGAGVTWLLGTSQFATVSGITPDFVIPPTLATGGGMVCWGAPVASNFKPVASTTWDHTNPQNYIDCLAYGNYSGPSNPHIGTPTTLTADGHSLLRGSTTNNNSADFAIADPATPKNNAGTAASLPATGACSTPTPTPTASPAPNPTMTPTVPPTPVSTQTPGCVGDCNDNGSVTVDELLTLVNIALDNAQPSACPSGVPAGAGVNIALIVEAVNNALTGCGAG
jgi:hypothetical protein